MSMLVRPATAEDVRAERPDVLPDHWREGGNRRSFVAVVDGEVVGHCRGIDNPFHPDARVCVLEVLPPFVGGAVADELLAAQREVSTRPLHLKINESSPEDISLARRAGGVVVQLMPPWRYVVDERLRAWAATHAGATRPFTDADRPGVAALEAEHYADQHRLWSPAAPVDVLLELQAEDHRAGTDSSWDLERSVGLWRDGELVAAALLWPEDVEGWSAANTAAGREVSLLSRPFVGRHVRDDKLACLAAVVASARDGDSLLADSHLSNHDEYQMMAALRREVGADGGWTAIVALPAPDGAPRPIALDDALVPDEAAWARGWHEPAGGAQVRGLYAIAREELADPLREAGLGEALEPGDGRFRLMWHTDGGDDDRPCPESPVWQHGGCYDVVVEHDESPAVEFLPDGQVREVQQDRLVLRTEGSTVLDVPWVDDVEVIRAHLRRAATLVGSAVVADIARFERENGGFLPGAEPR